MKKNRTSGSARPLSQEEIADLREDMQIASEWTKQELKRRRHEREAREDHQDPGN